MPINLLGKTLLLGLMSFVVLGTVNAAQYNAVVSTTPQGDEFSSINAALKSAPMDDTPFIIFLKNGVYTERLEVTRSHVTLKGENRDGTVIGANTAAGMLRQECSIHKVKNGELPAAVLCWLMLRTLQPKI